MKKFFFFMNILISCASNPMELCSFNEENLLAELYKYWQNDLKTSDEFSYAKENFDTSIIAQERSNDIYQGTTQKKETSKKRRLESPSLLQYACIYNCTKIFTSKKELQNHIAQIHSKIPKFHCSECHMIYTTSSSLHLHIARIHKEKRFFCNTSTCENKGFYFKSDFNAHMLQKHLFNSPFQK